MKVIAIFDNLDFSYSAGIEPIQTLPDAYSLTITSRLRSAKNPLAEHVQLQMNLDRNGLIALRKLIDGALA